MIWHLYFPLVRNFTLQTNSVTPCWSTLWIISQNVSFILVVSRKRHWCPEGTPWEVPWIEISLSFCTCWGKIHKSWSACSRSRQPGLFHSLLHCLLPVDTTWAAEYSAVVSIHPYPEPSTLFQDGEFLQLTYPSSGKIESSNIGSVLTWQGRYMSPTWPCYDVMTVNPSGSVCSYVQRTS